MTSAPDDRARAQGPAGGNDFVAHQAAHFERADVDHFLWQTEGPTFAALEARLLGTALAGAEPPLLEIGCGEGANLYHLAADGGIGSGAVGIDAFADKLRFARRRVGARFVCADGAALPFPSATFRTVLVRDVLHHLEHPSLTLAEACRVLAPGGRFVLIEPNAHNPLIRLQMLLVPAERGAARSDPPWLERLLAPLPLGDIRFDTRAPLPLERVVLHHRFGLPRLGRSALVARGLAMLDAVAARALPRSRWSTVIAYATRHE